MEHSTSSQRCSNQVIGMANLKKSIVSLANHLLMVPAVCFGSLSCWKMKKCILSVFTGCLAFSNKIFSYCFLYTVLSINTKLPTLLAVIHLHIITDRPPYFTVGFKHACFIDSCSCLHTISRPSDPNKLNLLSSDQRIECQNSLSFI